jgi:hypothetical protein
VRLGSVLLLCASVPMLSNPHSRIHSHMPCAGVCAAAGRVCASLLRLWCRSRIDARLRGSGVSHRGGSCGGIDGIARPMIEGVMGRLIRFANYIWRCIERRLVSRKDGKE